MYWYLDGIDWTFENDMMEAGLNSLHPISLGYFILTSTLLFCVFQVGPPFYAYLATFFFYFFLLFFFFFFLFFFFQRLICFPLSWFVLLSLRVLDFFFFFTVHIMFSYFVYLALSSLGSGVFCLLIGHYILASNLPSNISLFFPQLLFSFVALVFAFLSGWKKKTGIILATLYNMGFVCLGLLYDNMLTIYFSPAAHHFVLHFIYSLFFFFFADRVGVGVWGLAYISELVGME